MVYPVSSTSIPASNTFQPGGIEPKRPDEKQPVDSAKPLGSEPVRTQSTNTRDTTERVKYEAASSDRSNDNGAASSNTSRGSNLDISV